jgi:hypothetical protein
MRLYNRAHETCLCSAVKHVCNSCTSRRDVVASPKQRAAVKQLKHASAVKPSQKLVCNSCNSGRERDRETERQRERQREFDKWVDTWMHSINGRLYVCIECQLACETPEDSYTGSLRPHTLVA